MPADMHRKLTTILAADAAGYSRLMAKDEPRTLKLLNAARDVFARLIERHEGRIVDTAGDGVLAEFPSVVEAVQCAIEVQQELSAPPSDKGDPLRFRIGIHLGDVMVYEDRLVGEGVNLAARLEAMAKPGSVLISRQVFDQVPSKLSIGFEYLGERRPKNFTEDVSVFEVTSGPARRGVQSRVSSGRSSTAKTQQRHKHSQPEQPKRQGDTERKKCRDHHRSPYSDRHRHRTAALGALAGSGPLCRRGPPLGADPFPPTHPCPACARRRGGPSTVGGQYL